MKRSAGAARRRRAPGALQLIRKPDRDWNMTIRRTTPQRLGYNSLENPIGIETLAIGPGRGGLAPLQLIRKPDRDWNKAPQGLSFRDAQTLQLIRKPDRDWNSVVEW